MLPRPYVGITVTAWAKGASQRSQPCGPVRALRSIPYAYVVSVRDRPGSVRHCGSSGPDAADFSVGRRVWCNSLGHDGRQGAFAEYAVVSAERLYPLPAGVVPEEAAALLHGAAMAHIGLNREARLIVV